MSQYIDSKTVIVSFSNGVSNADLLRSLSNSVVLDGSIYILSHIEEYGVVRKKGKVFAAVFGGDKIATDTLSTLLSEANLRTKTPSDIKTAIWKKYIFISAFATLTSYYDKSIGYIYKYHRDKAQKTLAEISLVASRLGIDINAEIEKALLTASRVPFDSSTSMHLDFKNMKRDELKTLTGYIVQKAEELKVEVPLMHLMYRELLKRHIE
jgi:2-dehydropantoate 2-reductase